MKKVKKAILAKLESIFFPVRKVDAATFYKTKGVSYLPHLSHVIVAEYEGVPKVVNQCGKDYELVANKDLFTPMVKSLQDEYPDMNVKIKGFNSPSKFYVDFIIQGHPLAMGGKLKKDDVFPRIRVNNSYDGSVKFGYDMGFHRITCDNGASVPIKDARTFGNFMHTPGIGTGSEEEIQKAVTKLMDTTQEFLSMAATLIKGYDPLKENTHKNLQAGISRIAEVVEDITYPKKAVEIAAAQLEKEITQGFELNDWLVYNAMNYALYNNPDSRMETHKADKVDNQVLNYLIQY